MTVWPCSVADAVVGPSWLGVGFRGQSHRGMPTAPRALGFCSWVVGVVPGVMGWRWMVASAFQASCLGSGGGVGLVLGSQVVICMAGSAMLVYSGRVQM